MSRSEVQYLLGLCSHYDFATSSYHRQRMACWWRQLDGAADRQPRRVFLAKWLLRAAATASGAGNRKCTLPVVKYPRMIKLSKNDWIRGWTRINTDSVFLLNCKNRC